MMYSRLLLLWLFVICGFCKPVLAQNYAKQPLYQAPSPFMVDIYNYKISESQNKLEIYLNIHNPLLSFIKEGDGYVSRFYLSAMFYDEDGEALLFDKTWQKEIPAQNYQETASKTRSYFEHLTLEIEPKAYTLVIKLSDMESQREFSVEKKIPGLNFSKQGLAISTLMLLKNEHFDSTGKRLLMPNFSGLLNNEAGETHDVFFELYNRHYAQDSVIIKFEYWRTGVEEFVVNKLISTIKLKPHKTRLFHRIDLKPLNGGDYQLHVIVQNLNGEKQAEAKLGFRVRMKGLVTYIIDLEEAVKQLNYIADSDEIEAIVEAKTYKEKLSRFNAFWKKRDPSPQTEVNELMAEYYSRVSYANQHFSNYMQGWRTDMGMIYIKYGAPDFVERHPNNFNNKAYEIWEFHQHRRRFVFVDINGFGDYRLAIPEWDQRNRMN